jgi:hypothetical protein
MVPRSFHVTVRTEGEVLDLTNSDVTAPVYTTEHRLARWKSRRWMPRTAG